MAQVSRSYRGYVLGMLSLAYLFNFLDRQILVILQESIKADLGLSDTELGLLSGFAFALFYVSFGIPIARWADRGNRRNIISLAIAVWSGMTALCGLAQTYWQLMLARIGVGVGEAGASPPAHSMISDYYSLDERGKAMSLYSVGLYLGILVGSVIGGYIEQWVGWRAAFIIVGLPGVLLAIVFRLTVREPDRDPSHTPSRENMFVSMLALWKLPAVRNASLGAAFFSFVGYGVGNFMPSFLIRLHGMTVAEVGLWFGLIIGTGGAIGVFLGGYLTDRLGARDRRWYFWLPAITTVVAMPLIFVTVLTGSGTVALWSFFVYYVLLSFYLGPTIALVHALVDPAQRALASAFVFFILNLIGLGLGPLTVGFISDQLTPSMGVEGIRWAILAASIIGVLGSVFYAVAARTVSPKADGSA